MALLPIQHWRMHTSQQLSNLRQQQQQQQEEMTS
jgi:hypothetical protein